MDHLDFIKEPTKKALLKMFLPVMAGMILNLVYNIVDSLWVGNLLGDTALAALANATPIVTLTFGFGMGVTSGMAILLSQVVAKKEGAEEERIISSTLLYTVIIALAMVVVIELLLGNILQWMHARPETVAMAEEYLTIYILGLIPSYIFCHLTAMLRCYGDSVFQMISMLISSVLNAILDPILIGRMGLGGAAVATVFSQVVSLVVLIFYCRKKGYFHIRLKSMRMDLLASVSKLSVPTVIQQCAPSLSSTVLTACVNGFGIAAMAGYEVVGKLDMLLYFPPMVLNMVLTPIIGYCVGGKRPDRAKDYVGFSIKLSMMLTAVFGAILLLFAGKISSIFGCSTDAQAIVQRCMYFLVGGYLFNAVTQCFMGCINGYGHPASGMIITILNHIVIRIPFSILLSGTALGLDGIWITLLFSFLAAFACALVMNRRVVKAKSA